MTPKVKGIPLVLGGVTYILPPASLATLEHLGPKLDALNAKMSGQGSVELAEFSVAVDLVTACLRRNHADIDRTVVAEHIGLESIGEVMAMCYDTSGLLRKRLEAEQLTASTAQEGGTLGESTGTP